jgi:hypothetical protein
VPAPGAAAVIKGKHDHSAYPRCDINVRLRHD